MRAAAFPLALIAVATVALGVALASDDKPGRYTMTPTDGGALKLDTVTGAVSLCTRAGDDWSCKLTKDGEATLRKEIDGLKAEIDGLREQLSKTEEIAGIGDPSKAGEPRTQRKVELPTEKDVDQAFDYLEKMVKKLRERMNRLEGESKPGTPL